ncbi:dethiobiotin synthase [Telmatospirillum sp. J64-1]|uniref:dethiobiotin synthase n=1 Tax=Telmatospirillum sp. J64-1 TaxID=2502183 RepID=UPI00115EE180|nr:dethiobiotin synthase [Telmatospirillum sp. J64-1]
MPIKGVFVTGTDTGVGKTFVSAWAVRHWNCDYWKPVQSGTVEGWDSAEVMRLAQLPLKRVHPSTYALVEPLSPHEAARREGVKIELDAFTLPESHHPIVVEGAGGVMVPLNDQAFIIDLMARLGLPALVVARSTLGTINHTLLTLEAIRARGLPILGVVVNGPLDPHNVLAIEYYGRVPVLAQLPHLPSPDDEAIMNLPAPPPLETLHS